MTAARLVCIPIDWRKVGRSALRTVLLTTAAGLMASGKVLYCAGAQLQHLGEKIGR
jgi:hypothetical protein